MSEPFHNDTAAGLALIFDMDGVIVNSNPVHRRAWQLYNRRFGIQTTEDMFDRMYGRRNDQIVADFFGPGLTQAEIAAHGAAKEQLYRELMAGVLSESLVPGANEFLARHGGCTAALATNAERANVVFILEAAGLTGSFRVVVDGDMVSRPKPHPDVFQRAAELLGVHPRNCIVFEDSLAGVKAARAAGMRTVGLLTTHTELPGVDLRIKDFTDPELEKWLGMQNPAT